MPVLRTYASITQAADYVGVNSKTIRRAIARGDLTSYRLGTKLVRVDLAELDALLAAGGGRNG